MSVSPIPHQLRTFLAELYNDEQTSRRVVDDAEMDSANITFTNNATNNWHNILTEADRKGCVIAILDVAARDYKNHILEIARLKLLYLIRLTQLSLPDIRRFCQECRPRHFATPIIINTLEDVFDKLWNIADYDDRRWSIFRFTERVALYIEDPRLTEQFRQWGNWLTVCISQHNVTLVDLQSLRIQLLNEYNCNTPKESYLLVEVEPDRKTRKTGYYERFLVNIYLWKSEDNIECWHHSQYCSYELAEIPKLVYETLNSHEGERPTTIEFFLPYELLVEPIDRWEIETGTEIREKLRIKYRIAIRSWDRLRDPQVKLWRQAWYERWRLWQQSQKYQTFWCCSPEEFEPQRLYDSLGVIREYAVCLGLTFPPTKLLKIILQAGIPVMVWSREQQFGEHLIKQELEKILCSANLPNLPAVVFAQRACQEALDDSTHIGNHLVLFWDDPNRQLPKV